MNRETFLPVPFIFCVDTVSVIFKYEVDTSEKLPEFEYLLSSFAVWMINPTSRDAFPMGWALAVCIFQRAVLFYRNC